MINLGMLYLVSAIKDVCDVEYIDNNIQKLSTEDLINYLISRKPDIVCFGGTLTEWVQAKDVANKLQERNITTVYGGSNATANPEKHVKYFDYVFRGWAENALVNFLTSVIGSPRWRNFNSSICWEDHIVEPDFNLDINSLKYPARDLIDLNNYKRTQFNGLVNSPVDIVVASRGCPFSCKFCSSKSIWKQNYRLRSAEDVLWEIRYMKEVFGTKTIHFREDNLTINKNFLEELCRGLSDLKIDWICQSNLKVLDKETILMMKSAGCKVICCGFESANDSTLEFANKGFRFADVCKIISTFEECKIHYSGGFMVGLLNEGEAEITKTLAFTRTINKYPYSLIPRGAGRFVGWPTSEMYNEIKNSNNLIAYDWEDGEQFIPNTYKLTAHQVEDCISRDW
jgi:radical SAM superfamily enzyme YgiQ (UPF0313 family)